MRWLGVFIAVIFTALFGLDANAQSLQQCRVSTNNPVYQSGTNGALSCDTNGRLRTNQTVNVEIDSEALDFVVTGKYLTSPPSLSNDDDSPFMLDDVGNLRTTISKGVFMTPVAPATATATNGVLMGGQYNATKPTFADGQQGSAQFGTRGAIAVQIMGENSATGVGVVSPNADDLGSGLTIWAGARSFNLMYDGTTWDRMRGDSTNGLLVQGSGTIGGAQPTTASVLAGIGDGGLAAGTGAVSRVITCTDSVKIDGNASGNTELVALTASETIYVCGYSVISTGTVNFQMIYGTGTACATGETDLTGDYNLTAQAGISDTSPFYRGMKAAVSNALCYELSGATAVDGVVYYTKF